MWRVMYVVCHDCDTLICALRVHDVAYDVQCLLDCLEFQFDTVISDRSMILHMMFLLSVSVKHQEILTWEMFLNRFGTLCLEAQLDLENSSDISSLHGQ